MKEKSELWPHRVSPGVYPALSVIFLLVFAVNNLIYLNSDNITILFSDSPRHLRWALENYQMARSGSIFNLIFAPVTYYYPPLVYFLTIPVYHILGPGIGNGILGQGVFWILLGCSVYMAGRKISGDMTGFLGMLLCLSVPYLAKCSRDFCLDIPLTAMIALSLWMLMKSDFFSKPPWTVMFFVSFALAFLTKTMAPVYLALPVLAVFVLFFRKAGDGWKKRLAGVLGIPLISLVIAVFLSYVISPLIPYEQGFYYGYKNAIRFSLSVLPILAGLILLLIKKDSCRQDRGVALGLVLFMLICWPFYGIFMDMVLQRSHQLGAGGSSAGNVLEFLKLMVSRSWGWTLTLFTVSGSFLIFVRRRTFWKESMAIPFTALVGGLLTLLFFPIIDSRYFLPIIPAAAVIGGAGLSVIPWRPVRWGAVTVFCYLCLVGQFGWMLIDTGFVKPLMGMDSHSIRYGYYGLTSHSPVVSGPYMPGLCDNIAIMARNESFLLIFSAENPTWGARGIKGIIMHYRYRHGLQLSTVPSIDEVQFSPLKVDLSQKEVMMACLYQGLSARPSATRLEDYPRLMVFFINSSPSLESMPVSVRKDLKTLGISGRPKAYASLSHPPAGEGIPVIVHISLYIPDTKN